MMPKLLLTSWRMSSVPSLLLDGSNIFLEPFQHIASRIVPGYSIRESTIRTLTGSHSSFSCISPDDLGKMTSIQTKPRGIVFVVFNLRIPYLYSVSNIVVVGHAADVLPFIIPLFFTRVTEFSIPCQLFGPSFSISGKCWGPFQARYIVKGA